MPLKQVLVRSRCVLGCLVLLVLPTQSGSNPAQQSLVIYGVERYRQGDNRYDQQWLGELTRKGLNPIVYSSKEEMVEKILARLGPVDCIRELWLYGHGREGVFMLGKGQSAIWWSSSYIYLYDKDNETINNWRTPLALLKNRFCKDATVNLLGCNTGAGVKGAGTLFELAQFWGVKVRAPINKVYGGNDYKGAWQEATPEMTQPPSPQLPKG
jgi:hypothetical protein